MENGRCTDEDDDDDSDEVDAERAEGFGDEMSAASRPTRRVAADNCGGSSTSRQRCNLTLRTHTMPTNGP